jgi:ribosomal protein S18 acetylase RimI-like enzyme
MDIIKALPSDAETLQVISRRTFYEAFNHLNTSENMAFYMNRVFTTEKLLSELFNPFSEFYLAREKDKVIGYIKLNKCEAQSDIHDEHSLEIERIYIDKPYQGKGLGKILLDSAKSRAQELDVEYIWLGVWDVNVDAIRFYKRHGFDIFSSHPFIFGDEVQTDLLMKCVLKPSTLNRE